MGFLRLYLALLVVIAHCVIFDKALLNSFMEGPVLSVKFFFLLSGFYMSLVLDTKYKESYWRFIKARFFKIYPLYFLVLVFVFMFDEDFINRTYISPLATLDLGSIIMVLISNFTLIGSDLLDFIYSSCSVQGENSSVMLLKEYIPENCSSLGRFLVVAPAWSLGIEVVFYLIAPILLKSPWVGILSLFFISMSSRLFLFGIGYHNIDWDRHFIISEMVYFSFGMMSYQLFKIIPERMFTLGLKILATSVIFSWTTFYSYIYIKNVNLGDRQIWTTLFHWSFIVVVTTLVPFLFELSKNNKFDQFAGELSYPVYISHYAVLTIILPIFSGSISSYSFYEKMIFMVFMVLLCGFLVNIFFVNPIKKLAYRHFI